MSTLLNLQKQIHQIRMHDYMHLYVFKSNKNLYCQVIDPYSGRIVVACSTLDKEFQLTGKDLFGNTKLAASVLASLCVERIGQAGFTSLKLWKTEKNQKHFYHGRIKIFIESLRASGIKIN